MFREMRRKKQQITTQECIEILRSGKRGVLAVHGEDGYPYTIPMDYVYEDGRVYFHCAKTGHKMDAIRKDERVSFCVLSEGIQEPDDWWFHFTSVVIFGRIHEVTREDDKNQRLRDLGHKYMPSKEMVEEDMRKNAPRSAVLELEIDHMTGKRVKEN